MRSPYPQMYTRPKISFPDGRVVDIQTTFPKSGVYEVNGFKPVWQTDLFALDWDYLCSDDLERLVVKNRFALRGGHAIEFYDRGTLVKSYDCNALLRSFGGVRFLPYDSWDWHYRWDDDFRLSADHKAVDVSTSERSLGLGGHNLNLGIQEFYTFDIRTGKMTSGRSTLPWVIAVDGSVAVALSLIGWFGTRIAFRRIWLWRRNANRQSGFDVVVKQP